MSSSTAHEQWALEDYCLAKWELTDQVFVNFELICNFALLSNRKSEFCLEKNMLRFINVADQIIEFC